ncbi:MAG: hypothetical protein ISQ06_13530 [Planctomycetaceae bacterium]|nr:hypothetical protein [Planctomycetaceae bacterium]
MNQQRLDVGHSPASLVAILVAAHKANDRELERAARHKLEDDFGIKLRFMACRDAQAEEEVQHD